MEVAMVGKVIRLSRGWNMRQWRAHSVAFAAVWLAGAVQGFAQDMPQTQADVLAPSAALPHNLSPIGMFLSADVVVKSVMLGLLCASALTWTVWIAKSIELAAARRKARKVMQTVLQARNLAEAVSVLQRENGPGAQLAQAATEEVRASMAAVDRAGNEGLKERLASVLSCIERRAGRRMAQGTGLLATIGAIAPFVGLFGTVWGIMNSFVGISRAQTTNLAVVAPGIAEALLATAMGLVAAIPAVIIYNVFARSITGYRHILVEISAGIERLVSRDLDWRRADHKPDETVFAPAAE